MPPLASGQQINSKDGGTSEDGPGRGLTRRWRLLQQQPPLAVRVGAVSRPRYVAGMAHGIEQPLLAVRHSAIPHMVGGRMASSGGKVPRLLP